MWLPPVTTVAPAAEPVSLAEAKQYLRIDAADLDIEVGGFIKAARAQIEAITSTRLITQTVELRASGFCDLDQLPIGPVQAVTAISYIDPQGAVQALAGYELFGAGLSWGIRPALNTAWPSARAGRGVIMVTARVGYGATGEDLPQGVKYAHLGLIRAMSDRTGADVDHWLVNHRIWL